MKQLLTAVLLLSATWAQNNGLVLTKYPDGGLKVEGNYANGVRNGAWSEYWQEVWWYDYGEDGEANTKDTLENNGQWDSIEVIIPEFKPKLKLQGNYLNGNRDGTWT
jgi:antitoxin component YwqK of YwqJK toxin-antitoxin module